MVFVLLVTHSVLVDVMSKPEGPSQAFHLVMDDDFDTVCGWLELASNQQSEILTLLPGSKIEAGYVICPRSLILPSLAFLEITMNEKDAIFGSYEGK